MIIKPIGQQRRALLGQIVRFGMTGGALTVLVAAGYWAVAELLGVDPNLALLLVFLAASGLGYLLHSKWSFREHGSRDRQHVRTLRFLATNGLGFASNQFFVWLLVKQLGGPTWWPVVPIVLVTPLLTFSLHRKWTFA